MKKNTLNIILAIVASLAAIIGIFTLMSPAFNELSRGTAFLVTFGDASLKTPAIPLLIVAFSLECTAIGTALFPIFFKGKVRSAFYILTAVLTLASGIIFLLAKPIYMKGNPDFEPLLANTLSLGSGFITTAVFNFISTVVCILAIVFDHKAEDEADVFKN